MKPTSNPFIISGYEGAKSFCDRVEELHQLWRSRQTHVMASRHRPLSINCTPYTNRSLKSDD